MKFRSMNLVSNKARRSIFHFDQQSRQKQTNKTKTKRQIEKYKRALKKICFMGHN